MNKFKMLDQLIEEAFADKTPGVIVEKRNVRVQTRHRG